MKIIRTMLNNCGFYEFMCGHHRLLIRQDHAELLGKEWAQRKISRFRRYAHRALRQTNRAAQRKGTK